MAGSVPPTIEEGPSHGHRQGTQTAPVRVGLRAARQHAGPVGTQDSWFTLAERAEVKAANMSANDLCYFNFKTRQPAEINWYLYNKVGCRITDARREELHVHDRHQAGVVYLPKPDPAAGERVPSR